MSGGLKMPTRGSAAAMLSELNAEHAPKPEATGEESIVTSNVTTLQRTTEATNAVENERSKQPTVEPSQEETNGLTSARSIELPTVPPVVSADERAQRLSKAMEIAQGDKVKVVTVRAPEKLNDYIDRYVERMKRIDPKRKYRKEDAVAAMFAAFYADHPMPPAPVEEEL